MARKTIVRKVMTTPEAAQRLQIGQRRLWRIAQRRNIEPFMWANPRCALWHEDQLKELRPEALKKQYGG